eukprot:c38662_g1_i1 orf=3-284(-)
MSMYVCMCACMHACMDGWMDACMYPCMYVHTYVCILVLFLENVHTPPRSYVHAAFENPNTDSNLCMPQSGRRTLLFRYTCIHMTHKTPCLYICV